MKETIIKVLMVKPLKKPKEVYILNDTKCFDKIINQDAYLTDCAEILVLEDSVGILRNKDGALLDLKGNRKVDNEIIAGTFFVIGIDEKGFAISLSDAKMKEYYHRFREEECYTDEEVRNSYWNKFEESINALEKLL